MECWWGNAAIEVPFYAIFVLLEDQGLPEEVLCNKKTNKKNKPL